MSSDSLLKYPVDPQNLDSFHQKTSLASNLEETQDYLIFFISGNPGLLSFYDPFLSRLTDLLEPAGPTAARFHVYGHSFKGFEVSPDAAQTQKPYDLQQQIEYQEHLLMQFVKRNQPNIKKPLKVILVGHSVGSYILLELIQKHLKAVQKYEVDFDLIGGILLFPTIADIAQSPLGRIARIVLPLPGFDRIVGALAHLLTATLPNSAVTRLVGFLTGFPDYAVAAAQALLRSSMGVRQAIYLARDEMKTIKKEKWDDEVWGATTAVGTDKADTLWNLFLFWGQKDQWVADRTRDHIIAARGSQKRDCSTEECKCEMYIDDRRIPHDFCTTQHNSHYVAEKVKDWIERIIEKHAKAMKTTG